MSRLVVTSASLLTAVATSLAGCRGSNPAADSDALPVVRGLLLPHLTYAPLLIARDEGYFVAEGLDVRFVTMSNAASTVPLLIQGELDVLPAPISPALLNAIARGSAVRLVASKGYLPPDPSCSHMGIVVRRELLNGADTGPEAGAVGGAPPRIRRMSVSREPLLQFILARALESRGLSIEEMETMNIPSAAEIEALRDGGLDAAYMNEPWMRRLAQRGDGVHWIALEDAMPGTEYSVIAFGPRLVEERPDLGRRFIVAYLRGVRQFNQGKTDRNLEILSAATGLDREELGSICWPSFRDDGRINAVRLLEFQAWAAERELIDYPLPEDRLWDPSFTDFANQQLEGSHDAT